MCVFQKGAGELRVERNMVSNNGEPLLEDAKSSNGHPKNNNGPLTIDNLEFNVSLDELRDFMQLKGSEAKEKLDTSYGGIEGIAKKLNVDLQTGLNSQNTTDLELRIKKFGKNEIPPNPSKSLFRLIFEAFHDTTLVMLIVCAIISIGLSFYNPEDEQKDEEYLNSTAYSHGNLEWVEGVAIMIAVIVVVGVTAFNDWRKERQFRGLQNRVEQSQLASVKRNGQIIQLNLKELVVGDICYIKYGDLVPADGIIVQSSDLKIDESSLTGESDLIKKNTFNNFTILSGTNVMEGTGQFLIIAVGLNSQTGIIAALLGAADPNESVKNDEEKKDSKKSYLARIFPKKFKNKKPLDDSLKKEKPKKKKSKIHRSVLQLKLGKLALQIGYIGIAGALLAFILLVLRMAIQEFAIQKNPWSNIYVKFIISYLIQGITVIVVAVPEGLPLAVTLALAFAVMKMTSDNNLVRHLDACETMGSATTICSDKTGTLTTNRMTAVQCWIGDEFFAKIPKKNETDNNKISNQVKDLIYESISVNSNYSSLIEAAKQTGEMPKQIGNKTECGLLGFVNDLGGSYEQIRNNYPSDNFIKVFTFNSARKMMATVINIQNNNSFESRLHAKGASEIVLAKCSHYLDLNGNKCELTSEKLDYLIRNVVETMASDGLRTMCVAYRDFDNNEQDWDNESKQLSHLTCLCLVGIEDPVRDEVPDAIKKCQSSGVTVRMVTGDNVKTATSIAIKCGIISPGDDFLILESKEFNRKIKDENGIVKQELFDQVWPRLRVLARSSPQDKYVLVNGIVESKINPTREVVAVTGDGTNDGPALKRADVGFAMGIQGTDVAKGASDIILTDDNFSSIVKAMMWGRNVYDAIAKFLQFQLTANLAAGLFSVVCAATIQAVPLKAVQMLWVNLVMDTFASLALATEPPSEDLLKRKPYGRNKHMISATMLKNIIGHSIYQLAILFALVWAIEDWMMVEDVTVFNDIYKLRDPSVHFTIIFNAFVLMTLFNELNARKIHNERNIFEGISKNKVFIVIWLSCLAVQILIVNFGGVVFAVERLDWDHWMWCLFLGFGSLLWGQLVTTFPTSIVKKLMKQFRCCRKKKNDDEEPVVKVDTETVLQLETSQEKKEETSREEKEVETLEADQKYIENSRVLWLRGFNRVKHQLKVIEAFKSKLDEVKHSTEIHGSMHSLSKQEKEIEHPKLKTADTIVQINEMSPVISNEGTSKMTEKC